MTTTSIRLLLIAGLLLAALAVLTTLITANPTFPLYWTWPAQQDLVLWIVGCSALAGLLRLALKKNAGAALIALVVLHFALVVDFFSVLAVLWWFLSCSIVGCATLSLLGPPRPRSEPCLSSFWVGAACMLALFSVLVHFPINSRFSYCFILALPLLGVILQPQQRLQLTMYGRKQFTYGLRRLQQAPYWLLVIQVVVLGYVARHAFLPTIMFDDLSLHLRLWTELSFQHKASFDVTGQVWAVAPLAVDLQHAIISLLADNDGRAALNLCWFALLLHLCWQQLSYWITNAVFRTLLLLVFASTPLLGYLLTSLQTELFLSVLVMSALCLLLPATRTELLERLPSLLALAALCCATKLPGAVLGCLLLIAGAGQYLIAPTVTSGLTQQRQKRVWIIYPWVVYLGVLAVVALHSYWNAWQLTGNPLFPLYNKIFQSPYFDSSTNFSDQRWIHGFSFKTYWQLFFGTSQHNEGQDFVAGFQYLALFPLALLYGCYRFSWKKWLSLLIPLLGFGIIMFANTQYWRYLFPILPLASIVMAWLFFDEGQPAIARFQKINNGTAIVSLLLCLLLNFYFYPGISWLITLSPLDAVTRNKRELMTEQYGGLATTNFYLNRVAAGSRVLYPFDQPLGATFKGKPLYLSWVAPALFDEASKVANTTNVADFLTKQAVDYVIWDLHQPLKPKIGEWWLGLYLSEHGYPTQQLGSIILYQLHGAPVTWRPYFTLESPTTLTTLSTELTVVALENTQTLRYNVNYFCENNSDYFTFQLNWSNGTPYAHSLPCSTEPTDFKEAIPVPAGVLHATLFLNSQGTAKVIVNNLTVELH